MKKIVNISLAVICICFAISLSLLYFYLYLFHLRDYLSTSFLIVLTGLICLSTLCSSFLLNKNFRISINRRYMWCYIFFVYLCFLMYLLFLSPNFMRNNFQIDDINQYFEYLQMSFKERVNLKPFFSIFNMMKVLGTPYLQRYAMINIFGNLIAFMPFAFFMKVIFKKMTTLRFLFILCVIVGLVEIMQFFTMTGAMDIDDFMLNVAGAMMMYSLLHISIIKKRINQL